VSDFAPKPQRDASVPSVDQVRAVLRATQLPEQRATPAARKSDAVAVPAPPTTILRRLSIGAPPLTPQLAAELLAAIFHRQDWVYGETLDRALAALQRELTSQ
jgi:hypothetical protein